MFSLPNYVNASHTIMIGDRDEFSILIIIFGSPVCNSMLRHPPPTMNSFYFDILNLSTHDMFALIELYGRVLI